MEDICALFFQKALDKDVPLSHVSHEAAIIFIPFFIIVSSASN
jgi:hypothetical protein